jgi:GNAT superfamily N-acetyltransferase
MYHILKTKTLSALQEAQINQLWNEEYPLKLKDRFPILLNGVEHYSHYLIENENKNVLAWAVDFEKDNETRFSIIVSSKHQGKGLGSLLVETLKTEIKEFYGWVIDHDSDIKSDGSHYKSPMSFYIKHGFEVLADDRIQSDMLTATKVRWRSLS